MEIAFFDRLDTLPFFNPDLEDSLPGPVARLRAAVGEADGLLICSPEYAHGVSGLIKNALDWLVPSVEFPEKPVAVVNASQFSTHAHHALIETLRTMSARLSDATTITLPWAGRKLDAEGLTQDATASVCLRAMLDALDVAIRSPTHAA